MHAVVGLGSNVGSREAFLRAGRDLLDGDEACDVLQSSCIYATPPMGPPQPWFLNAAVRVATRLDAACLLERLHAVEAALGRVRRQRWGPRTLDLDLLWSNGPQVATPALQVPHPGLRERAFALAPLLDVCPELQPEYGPDLRAQGGPPPASHPFYDAARWRARDPSLDAIAAAAADASEALAAALTGLLARLQPRQPARCRQSVRIDATDAEGMVRAVLGRATAGFAVRHVTALRTEQEWVSHLVGATGPRWQAPARPSLRWSSSVDEVQAVVAFPP